MKKAFITGATGQDGYYLSKYLLELGYEVHGLARRNATNSIGHLTNENIIIHRGDLTDENCINKIFRSNAFDEIYHLGAQTFVKESFNNPGHTVDVNIGGTLNVLSGMRMFQPRAKLYNAGTSEMFGNANMVSYGNPNNPAYDETCEFKPRSPYGVSKVASHQMCVVFRDAYDLHISNGILFNHESPFRGPEFVTQKIILGLIQCCKDVKLDGAVHEPLVLGNMEAKRDWGFSGDYIKAMHLMLQQDAPDDYVIATGKNYSVEEFCKMSLDIIQKDLNVSGLTLEDCIVINDDHKRPLEVDCLLGNPTKAKEKLGWKPTIGITELITMMAQSKY